MKTIITLTLDEYEHLYGLLSCGLDFYEGDEEGEHKEYKEMNQQLYIRFTEGLERFKKQQKDLKRIKKTNPG